MWKSCCKSRKKFFFWLVLRDRINTRNLLRRKNIHLDDYNCVWCDRGCEEALMHLFFECPFSQGCWRSLQIGWNLPLPPDGMLMDARSNFNSKIFREILIIGCWALRCHRNAIIFDNADRSFSWWKLTFKEELNQVGLRAKPSTKDLLANFVCSLP